MMRWRGYLKQKRCDGFTIVELLVASAVFSGVALVALSSFVGIGRLFYKGTTYTQNQQTVRSIIDNVTSDLAQASNIQGPTATTTNATPNIHGFYYCFGNIRYTALPGNQVNLTAEAQDQQQNPSNWSKFGLLRDKLNSGNASCPAPFGNGSTPLANSASELLGNRMRLNTFCITPSPASNSPNGYGNLYDINVDVITGDGTPAAPKELSFQAATMPTCQASQVATCRSAGLAGSQYCAQASLKTSAPAITASVSAGPEPPPGTTEYILTVTTSGAAATIYVDGQICGDSTHTCTKTYTATQTVEVIASVNDPYHHSFNKWTGNHDCTSTDPTCSFDINSNVSMNADFN